MQLKQLKAKKILVAPLHWGLGHATRCIPIINALIHCNFEPVIASDGGALELLKKEFPQLKAFELPSYNITYPKKENRFWIHFLKASPHIYKTIKKEKKAIETLIKTESISGIISDNRFGVISTKVPSVYITHQLHVLSGKATWFSSKWHQDIIKNFNECWVPDFENKPNLSGKLGHLKAIPKTVKYIGPLSRFKKKQLKKKIDILVILSGPEPQRSQLESILISELQNKSKSITLVRGIVEKEQVINTKNNIKIYNYMTSLELENVINSSDLVISRSGYTTIMDLAKLGKKALLIPTPGQNEQLFLAEKLNAENGIPCYSQDQFKYENIKESEDFLGFSNLNFETDFEDLFRLF